MDRWIDRERERDMDRQMNEMIHKQKRGWTDQKNTIDSWMNGDTCVERRQIDRHLSIQRWIRPVVHYSQHPSFPMSFLFLKLSPPPSTALLVWHWLVPDGSNWDGLFSGFSATRIDVMLQE